jgi:hypothetical protein
VLDRSVAEPILNASRVVAGISQGVAAGVPEQVGVDRKGEARRASMRLTRRLTASVVNGPPRSVAKTRAESGNCPRSARSARTSQ